MSTYLVNFFSSDISPEAELKKFQFGEKTLTASFIWADWLVVAEQKAFLLA